jgi:hypothetical protein
MEVLEQKKEIVDWILTLENKDILDDIYKFKRQNTSFNFDEEFAKGLTVEEFRAEMKRRIRNYPLRK